MASPQNFVVHCAAPRQVSSCISNHLLAISTNLQKTIQNTKQNKIPQIKASSNKSTNIPTSMINRNGIIVNNKNLYIYVHKVKTKIPVELVISLFVMLRTPNLDSETRWTGELWSNTNLLKWQN